MAVYVRCGLLFIVSCFLCGVASGSLGFLNLEELTEMKYGIEILSEPVIKGQSKSDNIVTISSKYKQNYECKLPAIAVKFHQDKDEEQQTYSGLGISDLLKPMEAAPCLIKTKDWWTYEFCYGKHIHQYHVEESEVKGDILYLGNYQSEFDWNNETAKASKHHRLKRYHSQMYVNGSKCDLNGKSRETEVRFMCEEGSGDYIARVDEPQSCTYVLTVHTTRICHHPFLRPPSTGMPQSIRCHPALSPEQYVEYVKAQVSDTKRIVEELSEELKTLDLKANKITSSSNQGLKRNEVEESISTSPEQQSEEDVPIASVEEQGLEDDAAFVQEDPEADFWNKILGQQNEEGQATEADDTEAFPSLNKPPDAPADLSKKLRYRVIRNPEDLMKFITELKQTPKKTEKKTDGNDRSLQGAHSEEDSGSLADRQTEEEEDEQIIMQEFEKELENILLPKSDVSQIKDNVKTEMEKEFDNIINEAKEELETEGLKGEFDRKQASTSLATTLNKLIDKLDNAVNGKEDETESLENGDVLSQSSTESAVQAPSGKIEIKILTTGGFGDDDNAHLLSEEDTKTLKDIVFNILVQGTEEAHKEQKRQQQLEDNYRFVWTQDQDDSKSTSAATDSDDVEF
ncbi:protein OS-9 isoform X2 [Spea bombifrons]|uniref:protein OS-9 isoform X2 n=1 Tax=Spea bombifrons TaxID=233779 RepID=UPI00234A28A0|nr:protein OS-9 isoform X2 [Spea bombifrons]